LPINPQPEKTLKIGTSRGTLAVQFWREGFVNVWVAVGSNRSKTGTVEANVAAMQPTKDHVRVRTGKYGDSWLMLGSGAFENGRIVRHNISLDIESMRAIERHVSDQMEHGARQRGGQP
jgi:hypothetical protein